MILQFNPPYPCHPTLTADTAAARDPTALLPGLGLLWKKPLYSAYTRSLSAPYHACVDVTSSVLQFFYRVPASPGVAKAYSLFLTAGNIIFRSPSYSVLP